MSAVYSKNIWPFVSLILSVTGTYYNCTWTEGSATFDLCAWQKTGSSQGDGYWEVYDDRDTVYNNYTYLFNICADVVNTNRLNTLCTNQTLRKIKQYPTGYCTDILNTSDCKCTHSNANDSSICDQQAIAPININTAAYQMPRKNSQEECYRLHDGVTPPQFSLIDENDPTEGVSIKYVGGDWCHTFAKNREFIINFLCKDNYENVPDKDEEISEPSDEGSSTGGCTYILEIDSTIGCPTECPVIRTTDGIDALCAGNGVCEYDESNLEPKCFCFDGYYGAGCELDYEAVIHIELRHHDGKYIALLIVVVGCMTILGLIIGYLVIRIYISRKAVRNETSVDVSIHTASVQQNKQFKGSALAQPLAECDDKAGAHPIVV